MNKNITKLFSCCLNNKVVVIETNFKEFYQKFKEIEPAGKSDKTYSELFKKSPEFNQEINGKNYYFQKLV